MKIEEGYQENMDVNQFKRHLKQVITRMSDKEAIDLWNETIAKAAPTIALKILTKLDKPKTETPKKE